MPASRPVRSLDATLAAWLALAGCTTTQAEPAAMTPKPTPTPTPLLQTLDILRIDDLHVDLDAGTALAAAATSKSKQKLAPRLAHVASRCKATLAAKVPSPLDKTELAPSKDPRDYFSVAPYWDDAKGGAKPVRHDGRRRADADSAGDKKGFVDAVRLMEDAALCASLHPDPAPYVAVFAAAADAWFISPRSSLHPAFTYSQYRPDEPDNGVGIIDARILVRVVDAYRLLASQKLLPAPVDAGLVAWLKAFDAWLADSKPGRAEAARENNHGTFYLALRTSLALATRPAAELQRTASDYAATAAKLAKHQFAADGSQADELARTRPMHYTLFNLEAWTWLLGGLKAAGADTAALEAQLRPGFAFVGDQKRVAELSARDAELDAKSAKSKPSDLPARLWALQCRAIPLGLIPAGPGEPDAERKSDLRSLVCRQPD